jgi:hypothetical protein
VNHRNPPPLIALRNKPKPKVTQAQIAEARRAIETSGAGAYKQHGMMIRLEQAAARLGLKVRR